MTAHQAPTTIVVGIDIGGSSVKGAPVNVVTGSLIGERIREPTPQPSTPDAVAAVAASVAGRIPAAGAVGVTFPGVVRAGRIETATNLGPGWIGMDPGALFSSLLLRPVVVLNDADAAGIAEMTFGAGRGRMGVVVMVTLGTGIGSALFLDGKLVPNTEFGHIIVTGKDGEMLAAASVRTAKHLSWKAWAARLNAYVARLESLLSPDLIIIGGGISIDHAEFLPLLRARAELVPAGLYNDAGVVGAAIAAARLTT